MYAVTPILMLGILINETPTGKHYAVVFNKYLKFRELKLCFNLVYCCTQHKKPQFAFLSKRKVKNTQNYLISFVVAIAEVYKNEGNDEYNKKNFNSAIQFYTKGVKVNCKDEELNAKLYSNRAAAHFNLGKKLFYISF